MPARLMRFCRRSTKIENPRVGGSIPLLATSIYAGLINQAFPHRGTVTKA